MRGVLLKSLLISLAAFGTVQCGQKGDDSKVKLSVEPKSPIVIDTDFNLYLGPGTDGVAGTSDDDVKKITAPWFIATFRVENGSDQTITVQNIAWEATSVTSSGQISTNKGSLDVADTGQSYLMELAPGASQTTGPWYLNSLANSAVNFSYNVTIRIQGWFGPHDAPEKRLSSQYSFITK